MSEVGLNPLAILMLLALWGARVQWERIAYRRRVVARLRSLLDRDRIAVENRLYRKGTEKPREARPNRGSERIVAAR